MDPLDTTAYFTQIDSLDSTTNASNSIHKSTLAGGNCVAIKTVPRNYTTKPAPLLHGLGTVSCALEGMGPEHDQWLLRSRMGLADDLVKEYESKHGKRQDKKSTPKPRRKQNGQRRL